MIDLASLDIEIAGNPVSRWAAAGILAFLLFVGLTGIKLFVARHLGRIGEGKSAGWQAGVAAVCWRISYLFLLVVSVFAGVLLLDLPDAIHSTVFSVVSIAVFIQAALVSDQLVAVFSERQAARQTGQISNIENALALIRFLARTAIWSLTGLLILDNLGFDVTALVAGLGIGGVAIALAAQNVLGDLFASLAIILDKPFVVGDFIIFGEYAGTVERIGIKTTRLRSLSGEQLICSNNDLLSTRVRNLRRMWERRVVFSIGVVYETPYETLSRIPGMLKEIVESEARVRFDRAHFASYGDFSLNFEIVYYVLTPEYIDYMNTQQSINLKIFKRFEEENIAFAYPTRTVIVASGEEAAAAAAGA